MKIVKTTHWRNHDEYETISYTLFSSDNVQEIIKKFKMNYKLLHEFEGLELIAMSPEEHYVVFAEGLSKNAYWVKLTVTA